MNIKEILVFLEKANCTASVKKLKECRDVLISETCDVCTHGEDAGCFFYSEGDIFHRHRIPCKVGELLGETPY